MKNQKNVINIIIPIRSTLTEILLLLLRNKTHNLMKVVSTLIIFDSMKVVLVECSVDRFGWNCSLFCLCYTEHSLNVSRQCDTDTGECFCLPGWTGQTCDDDIDECGTVTNPCNNGTNACRNSPGSYICDCQDGFAKDNEGVCIIGLILKKTCIRVIQTVWQFQNNINVSLI